MINLKPNTPQHHSITISRDHASGKKVNSGIYLLGITLAAPCQLAFGRYRQGQQIDLPAGEYLYIGSAYGQKGGSSLGYRLLRHTCRTHPQKPHSIQPGLYNQIQANHLPGKIPRQKKLHWHIDYLLDSEQAEIFFIHAICTTQRMEQPVAETLASISETHIFAPGLGASDHAGGTHLFLVTANQSYWQHLPDFVSQLA
jgi:Uri superfamily endonuclease